MHLGHAQTGSGSQRSKCKPQTTGLRFRYRERTNDRLFHSRQAPVNRFEVPPPGRRRLQKLDHLLNGLRVTRGVARSVPIADKKSGVAHNAVADRTETRKEDKKPFLEER